MTASSMLRYRPDEDQIALAAELNAAIVRMLPVARLHDGGSESAGAWRRLEEGGVLSAGVAVAAGGSGLGAIERALIAMTLGRCLASPAVLATLATRPSLGAAQASARLAVALSGAGDALVWADEPEATMLLVREGDQATLHPLPADAAVADEWNWGTRLMRGARTAPLAVLDRAALRDLRLVDAAALAGIAAGALDLAVAYVTMREQFGRAIGSFQAVKHRCADMAIAARSAGDLAVFAATALDDGRDDAALEIECAFLTAAQAAMNNAGACIQLHGGMGFSAEAHPHLYLKRAALIVGAGGGLEAATARVAAASMEKVR